MTAPLPVRLVWIAKAADLPTKNTLRSIRGRRTLTPFPTTNSTPYLQSRKRQSSTSASLTASVSSTPRPVNVVTIAESSKRQFLTTRRSAAAVVRIPAAELVAPVWANLSPSTCTSAALTVMRSSVPAPWTVNPEAGLRAGQKILSRASEAARVAVTVSLPPGAQWIVSPAWASASARESVATGWRGESPLFPSLPLVESTKRRCPPRFATAESPLDSCRSWATYSS